MITMMIYHDLPIKHGDFPVRELKFVKGSMEGVRIRKDEGDVLDQWDDLNRFKRNI